VSRRWSPDGVLASFESTTIELKPEDDGLLAATLVRRRAAGSSNRAVLYLHGFVDYFFQAHVADAFNERGWDFYAVDLRRHGRSLRAGNRPNYCRDLAEYDEEITAAIDVISEEDSHGTLVLAGHSTGGLIVALYADSGARRNEVDALILNSPFFGFFVSLSKRVQLPFGAALGRVFPYLADRNAISPRYLESISTAYGGEWEIDERWKPLHGFPAYYGWINAIRRGHARLASGLRIGCPVLVLHSSRSMLPGRKGDPRHRNHDIVLDVEHMQKFSPALGERVTVVQVDDGIHDLFLSPEPARTKAMDEVFTWMRNHGHD